MLRQMYQVQNSALGWLQQSPTKPRDTPNLILGGPAGRLPGSPIPPDLIFSCPQVLCSIALAVTLSQAWECLCALAHLCAEYECPF